MDKRFVGSLLMILAEIAGNNIKAQELIIKRDYLNYCLNGIVSKNASELFIKQCLGAISAMVKAYIPGLVKFTRLFGAVKLKKCFDTAIETESHLLVHRCGVIVSNILGSMPKGIIKQMNIYELLQDIRQTMEKESEKYQETLDYINLSSNNFE